jgi:16S rRNA (guanine527-N7)-methyltransferase
MQLDDLARDFSLTTAMCEKLDVYAALLKKWQAAINLVGPKTLDDLWARHFLDSLQLIRYIPEKQSLTLVDIGSGAGFPGLVLAIARPDLNVNLIESDGRKAEFLRHVSRETSTPVLVHAARAETVLPDLKPVPDVIVARALASVQDILTLCGGILPHRPLFVLPKGKDYASELATAQEGWEFSYSLMPSLTDPLARIVLISEACQRDKNRV